MLPKWENLEICAVYLRYCTVFVQGFYTAFKFYSLKEVTLVSHCAVQLI